MNIVLFGGNGFVGAHYAGHLLDTHPRARLFLCDIAPLDHARFAPRLVEALRDPRCTFVQTDIRNPIPPIAMDGSLDLVVNLAAVHREPGHAASEYWECNVPGAENVTAFVRAAGCRTLLFVSSISPYGLGDGARDERTLAMPSSPYGASKLVAEKIHLAWQSESSENRLLIARPGVIFGAGEGGNVTRMIRFLRRGLFFYFGNQEVRKSGLFVKELCSMFDWGLSRLHEPGFWNLRPGAAIFNASFAPPPSVREYADAIRQVGGFTRPVGRIPYRLLYILSYAFFGIGGIHPVRVRKLVRPNLILPTFLIEQGYQWRWTLQEAFKDWKREMPRDW